MNSKNILKLLAVLLVAVNAILLFMVLSVYKEKNYIDESYINNTYGIFNEENISIESGAIPNERFQGYIYSAAVDEDYYESAAKNITGEGISTRFLIPGGYALTTETGKSLEFSGGYYFKYAFSENESYDISEIGTDNVSSGTKKKLLRTAEKLICADDEGEYCSETEISDVSYIKKDRIYILTLKKTLDNVEIYGQKLTFVIDEELNVLYAEGNWCFYSNTDRYSSQIYDQVNILFIEKAGRTDEDVPATAIVSVSPQYILYSNSENPSVLLVPGWKIEYADGSYKIFDAENGNLAKTSE